MIDEGSPEVPMADPRPEDIALWVSDQATNVDYKSLRLVISEVLASSIGGKSTEEISEIAEKVEPQVIKELDTIASQNLSDGVTPRFSVSLEQSTAHIKVVTRPELTLLKELQGRTPTEFEYFCRKVLEALGGKATVEGGPYDEGIDFTAFDLSFGSLTGPAPIGAKVVLVGQAKRYQTGNNVKETELRAFVGAAIKRAYKLKRMYTSQVGSLHPIVYAFWTTSDFHQSAKEFAREMGIWYLSGLALTQLAMRLGVSLD